MHIKSNNRIVRIYLRPNASAEHVPTSSDYSARLELPLGERIAQWKQSEVFHVENCRQGSQRRHHTATPGECMASCHRLSCLQIDARRQHAPCNGLADNHCSRARLSVQYFEPTGDEDALVCTALPCYV